MTCGPNPRLERFGVSNGGRLGGRRETGPVTDQTGPPAHPETAHGRDAGAGLPDLADLAAGSLARLVNGIDGWRTAAEPALGLRSMVLSDGPVGIRGQSWDERLPSVCLPSPTCLAASFDPALAAHYGAVLAAEARRKDVDVALGPTVNLHRSPLGGRHFEAYSEDPLLTGLIGVGYVRGVQAGGVAATPKHYVANDSETDRFTVDVELGERALREVYLAPFELLVAPVGAGGAGAWVVMAAYNAVRGVTMTENPLLVDPLEREWGFDGVIVSDWTAVRTTLDAALAATDLAMPGPGGPWGPPLVAAAADGSVPRSLLEGKVRRLLRLAARVGALDGRAPHVPTPPVPLDGDAVAREVAAAGTVLLTNVTVEGAVVLPLATPAGAQLPTLAVIGRSAVEPRIQGGGSATVFPEREVSPADGLRDRFGAGRATVHPGVALHDGPGVPALGELTDPVTGSPGLRLRFLDAAGTVLRDEPRATRRVVAFGDHALAGVTRVEAATRYTPSVTGTHRVGVRTSGQVQVTVDGAVVVDAAAHEALDGPGGGLLDPQTVSGPAELRAGVVTEIVATMPMEADLSNLVLEFAIGAPGPDEDQLIADAAAVAAAADVAVVVVGTTEHDESEGYDRTTLALPGRQDDLVRAVAVANPRTVVVVNAGSPVLMPWRDEVAAVLLTWFGGQAYGTALADVLSGDVEPGGRLPTTWPAAEPDCPVWSTRPVDGRLDYAEGIHVGYRGWLRQVAAGGAAPAYWFGHGRGYTDWAWDDIGVPAAVAADGPTQVTVSLRNTGDRAGRQVVQVYLSRPGSALDRPVRWFAGSAVVLAGPGAAVTARVPVPRRAFQHWASDGWALEPGTFTVEAGASVVDLPLAGSVGG